MDPIVIRILSKNRFIPPALFLQNKNFIDVFCIYRRFSNMSRVSVYLFYVFVIHMLVMNEFEKILPKVGLEMLN